MTTRTLWSASSSLAGGRQFGDQLFVKGVEDGRAVHPEGSDLAGTFDFQGFVHDGPQRCLKSGLALLDEGGHAFLLVLDREGGVEDAALEEQAFVEAGFEGAIDRLLDHHHHRQRVAGDGLRCLQGFVE